MGWYCFLSNKKKEKNFLGQAILIIKCPCFRAEFKRLAA
tara:strand:+ start:277 stop:393 length:117 start_codon:yes stop_codon:yes gene_type:complete